jgi:hypothetical protein
MGNTHSCRHPLLIIATGHQHYSFGSYYRIIHFVTNTDWSSITKYALRTSHCERVTKYIYVNWCKILTDGMTLAEGDTAKVLCVSLSGVLNKEMEKKNVV